MSDIAIQESCSCGASIRATGSRYRSLAGGSSNPNNPRGAEEIVERWRAEHKHDGRPDEEPTA